MAVVKVVMMEKDEGDTLARWLLHYSSLFGFENLTILDNGSTDERTLALLENAERRGVTVRRDLTGPENFHAKGSHVRNIIQGWDGCETYDFALPVDCDEYLAVFTEGGLSQTREDIHAAFDALIGRQCAFRLETSLFNMPGRPGWYTPNRSFHKGFVAANTIGLCDKGYHAPRSRVEDTFFSTSLTYLHEHHYAYEQWRNRLKFKVRNRVDPEDRAALEAYLQIPDAESSHAVACLLITEAEYGALYADDVRIFPSRCETGAVIVETPDLPPFLWDSEAYLARNPDVRGYHTGPLQHYLRHGYEERRLLR